MSCSGSKTRTPDVEGMAHFSEAGAPECGTCANLIGASDPQKGRCLRWAEFTGKLYRLQLHADGERNWWRGWPTINVHTTGCKYYEATSAFRGAKPSSAADSADGRHDLDPSS